MKAFHSYEYSGVVTALAQMYLAYSFMALSDLM